MAKIENVRRSGPMAGNGVYSIEAARLREKLLSMKNSSLLTDVTIKCHTRQIPAHKCMLSASSVFFKSTIENMAMYTVYVHGKLSIDCSEQTSDATLLDQIVEFMYSGSIIVTLENFLELLRLGFFYKIDDLIDVCTTFINVENCLQVYLMLQKMSSIYNEPVHLPTLNKTVCFQQIAWDLVTSHFETDLVQKPETLHVGTTEMLNLLGKGITRKCSIQCSVKFAEDWLLLHPDDDGLQVSLLFLQLANEKAANWEEELEMDFHLEMDFLIAARTHLEAFPYRSCSSSGQKMDILKAMSTLLETMKKSSKPLDELQVNFVPGADGVPQNDVSDIKSVGIDEVEVKTENIDLPPEEVNDHDNFSETTEELDNDTFLMVNGENDEKPIVKTENEMDGSIIHPNNEQPPEISHIVLKSTCQRICKVKALSERAEQTCVYCDELFESVAEFKKHLAQHVGVEGFTCNKCGKQFKFKSKLVRHLAIHVAVKPFKCAQCPVAFHDKSNLEHHMNIHTGQNKFECDFCHKSFSRNARLITHRRSHTGDRPFKCEKCDMQFADKRKLAEHKYTHDETARFSCAICTKRFFKQKNYSRHVSTHSKLECKICDKKFAKKQTLDRHTNKVHNNHKQETALVPTDIKTRMKCPQCNKTFCYKNGYMKHMERHSLDKVQLKKDRSCVCDVCGITFLDRGHFKDHLRIHTGERPFICAKCGKSFRLRGQLTLHMRIHSNERPFACTRCDKTFRQNCKLSRHERIHTGSKPYTCDVCQRGFTHNWNLKVHRRSHHKQWSDKLTKIKVE